MIHAHCSYRSHGQDHEATHRLPTKKQAVTLIADVEGWFPLARIRPDRAAVADVIAHAETALGHFPDSDRSAAFPVSVHIAIAEKG